MAIPETYAGRVRQILVSTGIGVFVLAGLITVSGTTVGASFGSAAVVSSVLVVVAALYVMAGMAIRQRVWHRLGAPVRRATRATREARIGSRRVF